MVKYAQKTSILEASKVYNTSRDTVRHWLRIYEKEGLVNKSRLGQHHPNKLDDEIVKQIEKERDDTKLGAYFIKSNLGLTCSEKTIHKKLKQAGKVGKPDTKTKKEARYDSI